MFGFGVHIEYYLLKDFCKIGCERMISLEVIQEINSLGDQILLPVSMQLKIKAMIIS